MLWDIRLFDLHASRQEAILYRVGGFLRLMAFIDLLESQRVRQSRRRSQESSLVQHLRVQLPDVQGAIFAG